MDEQIIVLDGNEYLIVDAIQNLRAEDSFIDPLNKLAQFTGAGEGRKHLGPYTGPRGEALSAFFDYERWGTDDRRNKTIATARETQTIVQEGTCFFSKTNMLKYLQDARAEYFEQEQLYKNDIGQFYANRIEGVIGLPTEHLYFSIYDTSDPRSAKQNRTYVRSDDSIWAAWRAIILPKISYLSILKVVRKDIKHAKALFYFRVFLDYQFREFVHPKLTRDVVPAPTSPRKNRIGQDKFRRGVFDDLPQCPFTKITDERLLVASHIKPYSVCIQEENLLAAVDPLNGLSLTPTYDWLFDQGYITFMDDGRLICGTQLGRYTWDKLGINPNAQNLMNIRASTRAQYLSYHRQHVFLDNIADHQTS